MELLPFEQALAGRRIFVTGHTGFTGGWACLWLDRIVGARITGLALAPATAPNLHESLKISFESSIIGDITNFPALCAAVEAASPDLVLHLAAQPLVRESYADPIRTIEVNTLGTAYVLEAARRTKSVRGVLCITTDKVYRNNEWLWPYRENDALGGKDPYSASKAAAEMLIQSYAEAFSRPDGQGPQIASARGGNIVGGGDWSADRLVPDFVRAVTRSTTLTLRYPDSTRPWQHVLALVEGYLRILAGLLGDRRQQYARAWNFGPLDPRQHSVREIVRLLSDTWTKPDIRYANETLPEARSLALDSSNACNLLGWRPLWSTETSIRETAAWYRSYYDNPANAHMLAMNQIAAWRSSYP